MWIELGGYWICKYRRRKIKTNEHKQPLSGNNHNHLRTTQSPRRLKVTFLAGIQALIVKVKKLSLVNFPSRIYQWKFNDFTLDYFNYYCFGESIGIWPISRLTKKHQKGVKKISDVASIPVKTKNFFVYRVLLVF